jgi:hypothetical protein
MSKSEKLIARLLSRPKDFTYGELATLLSSLGYSEVQGAGSRVCFSKEGHKIKLHKPHPGNLLKAYQLGLIIEELTSKGLISNKQTT